MNVQKTGHWSDDRQVRADPDLAEFFTSLRDRATAVDREVRHRHLSAMLAERPRPARAFARRLRGILAVTATKVAFASGVAVAGTGGMAVTGTLPEPVQQTVHELGDAVGLDLPAPASQQTREVVGQTPASGHEPPARADVPANPHPADERGPAGDPRVDREDDRPEPPSQPNGERPDTPADDHRPGDAGPEGLTPPGRDEAGNDRVPPQVPPDRSRQDR